MEVSSCPLRPPLMPQKAAKGADASRIIQTLLLITTYTLLLTTCYLLLIPTTYYLLLLLQLLQLLILLLPLLRRVIFRSFYFEWQAQRSTALSPCMRGGLQPIIVCSLTLVAAAPTCSCGVSPWGIAADGRDPAAPGARANLAT